MFNFRNKPIPILVPIIVSIMLHFTFLFLVSGYKGFAFPVPPLEKVFFIQMKEGILSKPQLMKAMQHPLPESFSEKKDIKEDESNPPSPPLTKRGKGGLSDENREILIEENSYASVVINNESVSEKATEIAGNDVENRAIEPVAVGKPLQIAKSTKEKLSFDIYWLGIYVGKAILEAIHDNGILRITSQAYSAPFISTFYKVEDHAESLIIEGIPVSFRIKQREGRYRSDKETIFDMSNRKVTHFNYLKGFKDEHIMKDGVAWDVISGFFYLRTQPLDIGKAIYIDIFDSNKFYKAKVEVLRKEKIEIPNRGEVSTVIVKPELQSEGLFQRKGDVLIWLTDDEKKIPVRVQTKVPVGNIIAELRGSEISK